MVATTVRYVPLSWWVGAIATALTAGVPVLVSPVAFWGRLVELWGLGAVAGTGLREVMASQIAKGIERVRERSVVENVRKYAKEKRVGVDGTERVSAVLKGLSRSLLDTD